MEINHNRSGIAWSGDLNEDTVRRIANLCAKGENNRPAQETEVKGVIKEDELFAALVSGPSSGQGWTVEKQPMHRLTEINRATADIIRQKCDEYPLTMKLRQYGQTPDGMPIEWYEHRHPKHLTMDELLSDHKYIDLYEAAVARGECSPLEFPLTRDDQEPNIQERYLLLKVVKAGAEALDWTTQRPMIRLLGLMETALKAQRPLYESIEVALRGEGGGLTLEQMVSAMAEHVPQLKRLVTWMQARAQAA